MGMLIMIKLLFTLCQVQFLEKIDAAIGDIISRLNKDELENGGSEVSWQVQ